jgi:hypothetical protein
MHLHRKMLCRQHSILNLVSNMFGAAWLNYCITNCPPDLMRSLALEWVIDSVRDLLDTRHRTSLDIAAAVKVFRDAARGMDFLHR